MPVDAFPWVNLDGARFTDETGFKWFAQGEAVVNQPLAEVWMVIDADGWGTLSVLDPLQQEGQGEPPTLDDFVGTEWYATGDDLEGLAAAVGIDATQLDATVQAWNAEGNGADPWRSDWTQAQVLDASPWHALRIAPVLTKNFGGMAVDTDGRVMDGQGAVIPGLYAAGELTGMIGGSIVGTQGWNGSMSGVILGGWIAGEAAAAEALGR
jgi:hypothetical protein